MSTRHWGRIENPNYDEWGTMFLFVLIIYGIVQLLYKVGYIKKERRGRIFGIVLAIVLVIGVIFGIAGI